MWTPSWLPSSTAFIGLAPVSAPPAESGAAAAAAAAAPAVLGAAAEPLLAVKAEDMASDLFGPPLGQRLWLEDLRQQLHVSAHFGVWEREEVRGLLVIGETSVPPPEHQAGI